jgi:hypothetical protein
MCETFWTRPGGIVSREKLLVQNLRYPVHCGAVFSVMDTASKTRIDNDGTAVTFFSHEPRSGIAPLLILDWDIVQIESATLETWLPSVIARLKSLSRSDSENGQSTGSDLDETRYPIPTRPTLLPHPEFL